MNQQNPDTPDFINDNNYIDNDEHHESALIYYEPDPNNRNNLNHIENSEDSNLMFFDMDLYNLPKQKPKQKDKNKDQINFVPPPPKKKVTSAWANLKVSSFNDNGKIKPQFVKTHETYIDRKVKLEKLREKERREAERAEEYNSNQIDMEIFFLEKIRQPLAGMKVFFEEEVYEFDFS
ncbi:hypothetical protein TRFO_33837 [Tritrichomonas foetus]|uniref:Uncharacterized protein n=1 Tax=Tritrichomonas foetus TaxID=1144522 RepID=A0A1J4JR22_9EUKA|nr:hypothetical protein TRFO_33837 [Tritrichomonas foetus]|eukprot:OHS99708.1 hypothetical protein TRFO_33837 [Tritrichomonas foetus]